MKRLYEKAAKSLAPRSLFKLNEIREEGVLESIDRREYFSLYLRIYSMSNDLLVVC